MGAEFSSPEALCPLMLNQIDTLLLSVQNRASSGFYARAQSICDIHDLMMAGLNFSEDVLETLCKKGAPVILLNVFQEDTFLGHYHEDLKVQRATVAAVFNIGHFLAFMTVKRAGRKLSYMKDFLDHYPQFEKKLWKFRSVMNRADNEQAHCLGTSVFHILVKTDELHMQYYGTPFPLNGNRYAHLLLHTWLPMGHAHPDSEMHSSMLDHLLTAILRDKEPGDGAEERALAFFRDATVEPGITERLVQKVCDEITQVDSYTLSCYLPFVHRMTAYCPNSVTPLLGKAVVQACERALCSQPCETSRIAVMNESSVLVYFLTVRMTEVPNGSDLVTNPDRVLPFVAHVYASTCGRDENVSAAIFQNVTGILKYYSSVGSMRGTDRSTVRRIRECSRDIWFPVLRQIYHFAKHDGIKLIFHTENWKQYAKTIGLNAADLEAEGRRNMSHTDDGSTRCSWTGCMCYVKRPAHKLRVCTRCKKVRYCNLKCQTLDWKEGGHRRQCVPQTEQR